MNKINEVQNSKEIKEAIFSQKMLYREMYRYRIISFVILIVGIILVKILENNNAKVINVDAWGQKTLAYEIKKGNETYKSGYYYVIELESKDDKAIKEFDRLALISSDLIRHLIIRKEK